MSKIRLIDANKLIAKLNEKKVVGRFNTVRLIEEAPTVEVPENVVNCVLTMFGDCSYNKTGCSDCEVISKIGKALDKQKRPIGKWLSPYSVDIANECSICHIKLPVIKEFYHYCPNCGADMREDTDDE